MMPENTRSIHESKPNSLSSNAVIKWAMGVVAGVTITTIGYYLTRESVNNAELIATLETHSIDLPVYIENNLTDFSKEISGDIESLLDSVEDATTRHELYQTTHNLRLKLIGPEALNTTRWPRSYAKIILINHGQISAKNVVVDTSRAIAYESKQGLQKYVETKYSGRIILGDMLPLERIELTIWTEDSTLGANDVFITSDTGPAQIDPYQPIQASKLASLNLYKNCLQILLYLAGAVTVMGIFGLIASYLEYASKKKKQTSEANISDIKTLAKSPSDIFAELPKSTDLAVQSHIEKQYVGRLYECEGFISNIDDIASFIYIKLTPTGQDALESDYCFNLSFDNTHKNSLQLLLIGDKIQAAGVIERINPSTKTITIKPQSYSRLLQSE